MANSKEIISLVEDDSSEENVSSEDLIEENQVEEEKSTLKRKSNDNDNDNSKKRKKKTKPEFYSDSLYKEFKKKLKLSIKYHCERCSKEDEELSRYYPKRSGPLDQFVPKTFDVSPCKHLLLPCRWHSYCEHCLFDRYKTVSDLGLGLPYIEDEEERIFWFPPPFKSVADNVPDRFEYGFGTIKAGSVSEAMSFCSKHGVPVERLSQCHEYDYREGQLFSYITFDY